MEQILFKKERNSSVELIKILAIFLIVINHVTQTLCSFNTYFNSNYVLDISRPTTSLQKIILSWMSASGAQGNIIFFACSSWFLINSKEVNFRKIFYILSDVWIINIIAVCIFYVGAWFNLSYTEIIACFFPTTFQLNWYITCYALFYLTHVGLNIIIQNCDQRQLLTINMFTLTLYCGINYLSGGHFFVNNLIEFAVIYFASDI